MFHLVLDHSALIPCGDKPREEKRAIELIGNKLPSLESTWFVSAKYLKTLRTKVIPLLRSHRHPLPKLQSSLVRTIDVILNIARAKSWICRDMPLTSGVGLKLHILARSAASIIGEDDRTLTEITRGVTGDDLEIFSIALKASRYGEVIVVTADNQLLQILESLAQRNKRITPMKPSSFMSLICQNCSK